MRAEGFACRRPRDKYIGIFDKKTFKKYPDVNFFTIFGHQNPGSGSGSAIRKMLDPDPYPHPH